MLAMSSLWVAAPFYLGTTLFVAQQSNGDPYVTLGIAGVLLGAIIVPSVRWHQRQQERQTDQSERALDLLEEQMKTQANHHDHEERVQTQIVELLQTLVGNVSRLEGKIDNVNQKGSQP